MVGAEECRYRSSPRASNAGGWGTWESAFQHDPQASCQVLGPWFLGRCCISALPSLRQATASALEAPGPAPSLEAIWKRFHYSIVKTKENKADFSSHKSQGHRSSGKWQALATRQLAGFQGRHTVVGGRVTGLARVPVGSGGGKEGLGVRPGTPGQHAAPGREQSR